MTSADWPQTACLAGKVQSEGFRGRGARSALALWLPNARERVKDVSRLVNLHWRASQGPPEDLEMSLQIAFKLSRAYRVGQSLAGD